MDPMTTPTVGRSAIATVTTAPATPIRHAVRTLNKVWIGESGRPQVPMPADSLCEALCTPSRPTRDSVQTSAGGVKKRSRATPRAIHSSPVAVQVMAAAGGGHRDEAAADDGHGV